MVRIRAFKVAKNDKHNTGRWTNVAKGTRFHKVTVIPQAVSIPLHVGEIDGAMDGAKWARGLDDLL